MVGSVNRSREEIEVESAPSTAVLWRFWRVDDGFLPGAGPFGWCSSLILPCRSQPVLNLGRQLNGPHAHSFGAHLFYELFLVSVFCGRGQCAVGKGASHHALAAAQPMTTNSLVLVGGISAIVTFDKQRLKSPVFEGQEVGMCRVRVLASDACLSQGRQRRHQSWYK
jgi:hypothetical protein